ncbi:MAG TPA: TPM domain-containing protein [Allosphingosinicella sp.]|nr:TPM domain-containing protein [Allosphingosinicella sp.]
MIAARAPRAALSFLALCLLLLLAACGGSEATTGGPAYPALTGRVVDNADMLPPADEAALGARLEALQRASSRQLVVATVPDLGGTPLEEYANGLLRHWRLGQRGADNGVLLLVARAERKIRIETGYQMEGIVTDALAGRIIREQMQPRFRADDYPGGIRAGTEALIAQLQAPPEAVEQAAVQAQQAENRRQDERQSSGEGDGGGDGGAPFALIFWIGVTLFIVFGLVGSGLRGQRYRGRKGPWGGPVVIWGPGARHGRRKRGWDDWDDGWGGWGGGGSWGGGSSWGGGGKGGGSSWGGGGGGGFSGGGGSGGGGGASGGW